MRGLAMDFADDAAARDVRDEYLFGKAFLVAPVHQYKARDAPGLSTGGRRLVRLPHRRRSTRAARRVEAAGAARRMPLYVRAGSIVPVGPDDPVHGREARRARSRCSCSPAPTAASISTKTTA